MTPLAAAIRLAILTGLVFQGLAPRSASADYHHEPNAPRTAGHAGLAIRLDAAELRAIRESNAKILRADIRAGVRTLHHPAPLELPGLLWPDGVSAEGTALLD